MKNKFSLSNHLAVKGLSCSRGRRELFSGLDFDLHAGEALLIEGENGTGKTSLLRLMASLTPPDSGVIEWSDRSIHEVLSEYRSLICYIGHLPAVKSELTVSENIQLFCSLEPNPVEADVATLAMEAGLRKRLRVPCGRLSAGQKRRLSLLRLLVAPRPLWILDEPSTALDADFITRLEQWIEQHLSRGGMAVVSTHRELQLRNSPVRQLCL